MRIPKVSGWKQNDEFETPEIQIYRNFGSVPTVPKQLEGQGIMSCYMVEVNSVEHNSTGNALPHFTPAQQFASGIAKAQ